jgi:hypothetical protein
MDEAEANHGLTRADLNSGVSAFQAARTVAAFSRGRRLHCDGFQFDSAWLEILLSESNDPTPVLSSSAALHREVGPKMTAWLHENLSPHRAGPDAQRIVRAFAYAIGLRPPRIDDMRRGWPV